MGYEWPVSCLGDLVNLTTGFPFKSSRYSERGTGIRLLRGDNVVQGKFRWSNVKLWPENEYQDKHKKYWLSENDVILAMDRPWIEAGLKTAQITNEDLPCLLVQRLACLRAKSGVDQNFIRYVVSGYWFVEYVKQVQTGTAVPHISPKQILSFELGVPSYEVQKEIGKILPLPEEIRREFPDGFEFLDEMGWVPRGWDVGNLVDVLVLQRGFDLPKSRRTDGPFPLASAGGQDGTHSEFKAKGPGVVTGRSGKIGVVSLFLKDHWPLNTTLWIKEFLNSNPFHAYFLLKSIDLPQFSAGSAVPTLNRNHVHSLPQTVVPKSILDSFQFQCASMYEKKNENELQSENLSSLRDTLLPKLLSGQLTIPDAEKLAANVL